jgi:gluconate 5-dehydrogenase
MAATMSLFDVKGKVACVTGASSGLGRAAATMLSEAGAKVVGVARREAELKAWADSTRGDTEVLSANLADRDSIPAVARSVENFFGPPDILINAAGINTRQVAEEVTPEGWDITLTLNLAVPFFLAREFYENMKMRGWGRIVNFASLQSFRAFHGGLSYGASKGGVAQLTRAMAEAWSKHGIMVNAVAPGFFPTELTDAVFSDPERAARNAAQTCIGRNGDMSDFEGPLLFLCSDACGYVTGQILSVDGGFTAK